MINLKKLSEVYNRKIVRPTGKAIISCENGECSISSDTDIMGIELTFKGKATITPQLPQSWYLRGTKTKMLIFTLQNVPIKNIRISIDNWQMEDYIQIQDKKAVHLVQKYIELMMEQPKDSVRLVLNADGTTNALGGATYMEILKGYCTILVNMNKYFGVPIEFFLSGQPGNWHPQWDYPSHEFAGKSVDPFKPLQVFMSTETSVDKATLAVQVADLVVE